jgi:putative phage-type endonuclease
MGAPDTVVTVDRQKFLGGSDVAAIFGVSPWRTPLDLYLDKIRPRGEEALDPEKKKFFARRKRQEPVVAEMLADEYGVEVTRLSLDDNPNRYQDEEHPFLAAEIDFEFFMTPAVREHFPDRPDFAAIPDGTLVNGEIKTVHPFKASEWGEEGSEEVPIHYACQAMQGLGITKRPAVLVAALFGLDTLVCFPVMRDEETIRAMRTKAVNFWTHNVLNRIPPDPVNIDDVKRMYAGMKGRPVILSDEAHTALVNLDILRGKEKQFEIDKAELEWQIARCVAFNWGIEVIPDDKEKPFISSEENAVLMYGGRQAGSWNRQRGSFLDQKRLALEKPEIVAAYKVEHKFRVMRIKKGK